MSIEEEREAFEAWFDAPVPLERLGDTYKFMAAHSAWRVWQARAALNVREHGDELTAAYLAADARKEMKREQKPSQEEAHISDEAWWNRQAARDKAFVDTLLSISKAAVPPIKEMEPISVEENNQRAHLERLKDLQCLLEVITSKTQKEKVLRRCKELYDLVHLIAGIPSEAK